MHSFKDTLGKIFCIIYFVFLMVFTILFSTIMPFFFLGQVGTMRSSGFADLNIIAITLPEVAFVFGLSLLIPPLRKMYSTLPWLFPLVKVLLINHLILAIGYSILSYGYEVQNLARQSKYFVLMLVQLVVCRLGMCIYFKLRPAKCIEEVK